jgi:hypothetical protein
MMVLTCSSVNAGKAALSTALALVGSSWPAVTWATISSRLATWAPLSAVACTSSVGTVSEVGAASPPSVGIVAGTGSAAASRSRTRPLETSGSSPPSTGGWPFSARASFTVQVPLRRPRSTILARRSSSASTGLSNAKNSRSSTCFAIAVRPPAIVTQRGSTAFRWC